jgi:hypothetical protein
MIELRDFPPYGVVPVGFAEQIEQPLAPRDFDAAASRTSPGAAAAWHAWLDEVAATIHGCLWPAWDHARRRWHTPDLTRMNALTAADFAVLRTFADARHLTETSPVSDVRWCSRHEVFFLDEDQGRVGERLSEYSLDIPLELRRVRPLFADLFERKIGHTAMQLKHRLQRPRPHQVATLAGFDGFTWHAAATAHSPSMCSGHALQGLLLSAGVFETLAATEDVSPAARTALARFAVDVGDRRVFAGVHYPSDNIASWIVAASLARRVLRPETAAFLRDALEHSEVLARLRSARAAHPVLGPALDETERALATT